MSYLVMTMIGIVSLNSGARRPVHRLRRPPQGAGDDAENVARVVEEEEEEEEMEVGAPELTFAPTSCSTQNFNGVSRLGGGGGATTTFDPLLATTTFNTGPTAVAGGNETRQLSMCASQYKTQDLR